MSGSHLSKEFFDLVKSIGESRSKQEEDKIIVNEVHTLKQKMSAKDVSPKKMKEYLIRMIYVEMLGHDASFGHIHAVKMAHSRALLEKRVGYLAVSLTLHKDHSFMLLLINTMQKDLESDNYLEASMALTVVSKLVNAETIPAILPLVVRLLDHKEGSCKKKAVMVLHRFHQIDPTTIATLGAPIRKALCDSNISVMAASLNLFLDLCIQKPSAYKDLVPDFVSILKQVIEHRLPRDYDYHRVSAPWVQLKLLQILAVLGASDKNASEGMYEVLREVMKRADIGINVGYAIVYECVRTVTAIYPDPALIEDAASSISRFITSDNHNLKYLGVNALASIVQIDSKYAAEHQLHVIDALEDPDETLKRKTLDLLYSMTNPQNVTVIVQKLTQYLQTTTDQYLRSELVSRINQLAEKYAPSNEWFLTTMNNVFELSGHTVTTQSSNNTTSSGNRIAYGGAGNNQSLKTEMSQSMLRLISENANQLLLTFPDGRIPESEDDIRTYAVDTYIQLLSSKRKTHTTTAGLPDILIQVIAWVLGEYGHLAAISPVEVLNLLISLMERQVDTPALTKSWILQAIVKMTSKLLATGNTVPQNVVNLITKYQNSLHVDLQQRSFELMELLKTPQTFTAVCPPENTFDLEFQVDSNLSFLDSYVATALKNGAKPYNQDPAARARLLEASSSDSYGGGGSSSRKELKFAAYAAPEKETASAPHHAPYSTNTNGNSSLFESYTPSSSTSSSSTGGEEGIRLGSNGPRRWGPSGYNDPDAAPPAAAAAASPYVAQPTIAVMPSPSQQQTQAAAAAYARQQEQEREAAMHAQREKERKAKEIAARPRELTEREKMANSLFAGVGGIAAPTPTGPARRQAPQRNMHATPAVAHPAVVAQQPVAQPAPAANDFLGGLIEKTTTAPVAAPKPVASPADSLDLLFGPTTVSAPAATTPAARTQPQAAAAGGNLFDMLGGGSSSSSSASNAAPLFDSFTQPAASSGSLLDDPFNIGGGGASGGNMAGLGEGATKYGAAGSHMSAQLSGLQKPSTEATLINDQRVQMTSYRGFTENATVVALFISNKTAAAIPQVNVTMPLHAGYAVTIQSDGGSTNTSNQGVQTVNVTLQPRSTVTLLLSLTVRELSVFSAPLAVTGTLTFTGASFPFATDLLVTDFLRPSNMKTDAYGAAWKVLTDEVKGMARPTTVQTSAEFMTRVGASVHAFPVQTIGVENICAARVVAAAGVQVPANYFLVLIHGKVHSHVDLIVRSKSKDLSSVVAKQVAVLLK